VSIKNTISRRKFLAIAGMTAATGVAAACGGTAATTAPQAKTEATKPPEPTTAPKPAEAVTLTYVYPQFTAQSPDQGVVEEAINKVTMDKINAKIKLMVLEFGSWNDKITLMSAGGEQYDLAYTANWTNDYYKNVSNGQFLPLDDLLPNVAPGYWKSMPVTTWAASKVNGKAYGAINQQMFPKTWGFLARKDLVEKYKLDLNAVKRWPDIESWLDAVKKGEGFSPWPSWPSLYIQEIFSAAPVDDGIGWIQVGKDDKSAKAVNYWTTQEFSDTWALGKKWYDAGYMTKEDHPESETRPQWAAGKAAIGMNPVTKPHGEFEAQAILKQEVVLKSISPAILTTAGITATMTGLSRTTVSKEAAAKWLELINTDKPTYNMLCIGIEGKHWNWKNKEKEVIEQVKDSAYNPTTDWMFGNQFMAYYRDERQVGSWDETKAINDGATPSPTLGFVMDREPVKNEIAAVAAILTEWTQYGPKGKPATELPKAVDAMNAAGAKKIVDEMQKQIDAWKK
jgi:putative aldouronate transport system substrate-binding protein